MGVEAESEPIRGQPLSCARPLRGSSPPPGASLPAQAQPHDYLARYWIRTWEVVKANVYFMGHLCKLTKYRVFFLGPPLLHMEVPRPRAESELQLPACTTATAMPDPSHDGNL